MKNKFLIFGLFLILSGILTYPLIFNMTHSLLEGSSDPLLNTWILGWDIHKLSTNLANFWDTNIFYPENLTLAYSEHLIGSALFGLPVFLLTKNIVFTYNFIALFSFLLSALGAYCLVYYLTKNKWAGIIAGIIYAFAPLRLAELGHFQLLTAQWIPFCLLYLHKFFKKDNNKNLILFIFFFIVQSLSCLYYATFLSLVVIIFILYYFLILKKYTQKAFWMKLVFALIIIFSIMLPFALPYYQLQKNMGFVRHLGEIISFSAQPQSYLAAPSSNWFWGKITSKFGSHEKYLFVGLIAMVLMVFGWLLELISRKRLNRNKIFYLLLLFLAFILSLGPIIIFSDFFQIPGPYSILFEYIPGFNGIRVPARLGVLFLLATTVLAGYGLKEILRRWIDKFNWLFKYVFIIFVILFLIFEYISIPLPVKAIKVNKEIPEVYQWLAQQPGDFAIIELPMPPIGPQYIWYEQTPKEAIYLYYSTYHWKKIVNGYSGYTAPSYFMIWQEMDSFPSQDSIDLLRGLGVKYCIVHLNRYAIDRQEQLIREIEQRRDLKLVKIFDSHDYVYQIEPIDKMTKDEQIRNLDLAIYLPDKISLPPKIPLQFALIFRNNSPTGYVNILKKNCLVTGEWFDGKKSILAELVSPIPSVFIPAKSERAFIFQISSPKKSGLYDLKLIFKIDRRQYPFYLEKINVNIEK